MGWLTLQMTKLTHRSVTSTLEVSSTEKLVRHYNVCVESYRDMQQKAAELLQAGDVDTGKFLNTSRCQDLISDMQMKVAGELARRGVMTDMARAMAERDAAAG